MASVAGKVLDVVAQNPGLLEKLVDLLSGLFKRKQKPVAPASPTGGDPDDDFPDDTIPAPTAPVTISKVRLKLARVQLSKQRFPNAPDGGLLKPEDVRAIEAGTANMNYGSKFWLDLTAYDQNGLEIMRDRVITNDLCYKTEHHCGDAFIIGHGGTDQNPTAGYETNDTNEIGNGDTAWRSSCGFLHQMKAHGQGSFLCFGKVVGMESNSFTIKVS